jgi:plasmid recombination enzyme
MFEESRIEYNSKQSIPSRMINDYFKHVSDDEQKDLACEIIIELGNKDFWDTKNLEYKQKMVKVFNQQLKDLEHKAPDFKICSAVVHLDEGSPHMHIVGVPIKYNNTRGMSIQVGKSAVFTKEKLEKLQDYMREKCINTYNEVYGLEDEHKAELKEKQKGRAFNIHVKDMANYNEIMKQLEVNKESIKKSDELVNKINKTSKELDEIFYDIEPDKNNNYVLTEKQISRFIELTAEVDRMEELFSKLRDIYQNINKVKDNVEYLNKRNNELIEKNDQLADMNRKYERKIKHLEASETLLKTYINSKDKEHLELITYLCKHANSKDYNIYFFFSC